MKYNSSFPYLPSTRFPYRRARFHAPAPDRFGADEDGTGRYTRGSYDPDPPYAIPRRIRAEEPALYAGYGAGIDWGAVASQVSATTGATTGCTLSALRSALASAAASALPSTVSAAVQFLPGVSAQSLIDKGLAALTDGVLLEAQTAVKAGSSQFASLFRAKVAPALSAAVKSATGASLPASTFDVLITPALNVIKAYTANCTAPQTQMVPLVANVPNPNIATVAATLPAGGMVPASSQFVLSWKPEESFTLNTSPYVTAPSAAAVGGSTTTTLVLGAAALAALALLL